MAIELKVPSVGESITEVVVGEWLKGEGDWVDVDESVVIIETDKATVELPAPAAGTLSKILKKEGEDAAVGEVIGHMEASEKPAGEKAAKGKKAAKDTGDEGEGDESDDEKKPAAKKPGKKPDPDDQETHVMPSAQRLLAQAGLSAEDVEATGPGGRLLKEDVLRHQKDSASGKSKAEARGPAAAPAPSGAREEEIVRMTTLRKRIAERLVASQQTAALLTTFNEVDMSAVIALRKRHQDAFVKRHGIKLGFMSFFVKAVIEGLKEIPALNAEIRDGSIVYRNYFDIGVAVGGGKGLVVPVIRNAERLSFAGVEQNLADLAGRARDNKLTPDDLQGGTFTISNGGIYGSMLSTPIVNPPQSGILGMHAIKDRPMAVDGEVVIRPVMYVALTYDHRLVDGREAVTFLVRVKDAIEEPARMLVEV